MLKWVALILVTSVLCWGDSAVHGSSKAAKGEVTDRISSEPARSKSRPIAEDPAKTEVNEEIDAVGKAQLEELIEKMDTLTTSKSNKVGEQSED